MLTDKQFKSEITQRVSDFWAQNQSPLLVSVLGTSYPKAEIREVTKGAAIVKWIQENEKTLKVKLIHHPFLKEKIGLIPEGQSYEYEKSPLPTVLSSATEKELTLAFLELLKVKCTPQELDQVQIPTKILLKLLT